MIVCPVALHPDGAPQRVAAIRGPAWQLLHVSAQGAQIAPAAAQALFDHAGLETRAALTLGTARDWHYVLCRIVPPVRDTWRHAGPDGVAEWGWMPLDHDADLPGLRGVRDLL